MYAKKILERCQRKKRRLRAVFFSLTGHQINLIIRGCSKTSVFGTATLDLYEKVGANLWFD